MLSFHFHKFRLAFPDCERFHFENTCFLWIIPYRTRRDWTHHPFSIARGICSLFPYIPHMCCWKCLLGNLEVWALLPQFEFWPDFHVSPAFLLSVILLFLRNFKNLDIEVFRRESSQNTKIVEREKTQGKMYRKTVLLFYISPNISNLPCPQRWAVFIMKHNRSS